MLGNYTADNKLGDQRFSVKTRAYVRYLKLQWATHYGSEFYCTLTRIMVHGSTGLEDFQEAMQAAETEIHTVKQQLELMQQQQHQQQQAQRQPPPPPAAPSVAATSPQRAPQSASLTAVPPAAPTASTSVPLPSSVVAASATLVHAAVTSSSVATAGAHAPAATAALAQSSSSTFPASNAEAQAASSSTAAGSPPTAASEVHVASPSATLSPTRAHAVDQPVGASAIAPAAENATAHSQSVPLSPVPTPAAPATTATPSATLPPPAPSPSTAAQQSDANTSQTEPSQALACTNASASSSQVTSPAVSKAHTGIGKRLHSLLSFAGFLQPVTAAVFDSAAQSAECMGGTACCSNVSSWHDFPVATTTAAQHNATVLAGHLNSTLPTSNSTAVTSRDAPIDAVSHPSAELSPTGAIQQNVTASAAASLAPAAASTADEPAAGAASPSPSSTPEPTATGSLSVNATPVALPTQATAAPSSAATSQATALPPVAETAPLPSLPSLPSSQQSPPVEAPTDDGAAHFAEDSEVDSSLGEAERLLLAQGASTLGSTAGPGTALEPVNSAPATNGKTLEALASLINKRATSRQRRVTSSSGNVFKTLSRKLRDLEIDSSLLSLFAQQLHMSTTESAMQLHKDVAAMAAVAHSQAAWGDKLANLDARQVAASEVLVQAVSGMNARIAALEKSIADAIHGGVWPHANGGAACVPTSGIGADAGNASFSEPRVQYALPSDWLQPARWEVLPAVDAFLRTFHFRPFFEAVGAANPAAGSDGAGGVDAAQPADLQQQAHAAEMARAFADMQLVVVTLCGIIAVSVVVGTAALVTACIVMCGCCPCSRSRRERLLASHRFDALASPGGPLTPVKFAHAFEEDGVKRSCCCARTDQ